VWGKILYVILDVSFALATQLTGRDMIAVTCGAGAGTSELLEFLSSCSRVLRHSLDLVLILFMGPASSLGMTE